MAEVVEPNFAHPGPLQRPLESLAYLAALERMARVRVAENEIVFGLVGGGLEQQLELAPDPVGHRHRPA